MYPTHNLQVAPNQCILLIIDPQNDFHDKGSLAVPGASAQALKIAKFIKDNKDSIGEIFITLDSHHKKHIAHKAFWSEIENDTNNIGNEPSDFDTITEEDLQNGKWYPKDCSLQSYCLKYTRRLEAGGKFKLTIWPDHCLIGSDGHAIEQHIQEAVREWDIHHYTKTVKHIHKGMNCLTEMYSAIEAEVPIPSDPTTTRNMELLHALTECDRLIVCGQALSHCVNFTVRDILRYWNEKGKDPSHLFLLTDACAPVKDCEVWADTFVKDMKEAKVTVTTIDKAMVGWKQGHQAVVQPAASFKLQDSSMALLDVDHATM